MKLTDQQLRAVEHGPGNLQLIACAGSGKTEVVARRVVHLLNDDAFVLTAYLTDEIKKGTGIWPTSA